MKKQVIGSRVRLLLCVETSGWTPCVTHVDEGKERAFERRRVDGGLERSSAVLAGDALSSRAGAKWKAAYVQSRKAVVGRDG